MIDNVFTIIKNCVSGERAYKNVRAICNYHRIQASPGYREAANYCVNELQKNDIQAKVLSYPANSSTTYWTQKMFKEWKCEQAYLEFNGKTLCDFDADPHSIMQRSIPIDFSEESISLFVMNRGSSPNDYDTSELKGKLLLINDDHNKYIDWAIGKYGAVGFVSDRVFPVADVRTREDLYNTRMYQSFWYFDNNDEVLSSGFVITPKQGDLLRAAAQRCLEEHKLNPIKPKYINLCGKIISNLYEGEIEVVESLIRGETNEEIIVCAHLCHPKCSANDNASGVAGAVEVMKSLTDLVSNGKLKKPKHSIRMILVPEMTGTYAYLANREKDLPNILAGINLDMIGGSQIINITPITVTGLPNAAPSFIFDLCSYLVDLSKCDTKGFNGQDIATYLWNLSDYSGGSDHYIMSDPSVGIPCLMLGQWPDKFYHTNADTIEKVDPEVLKRSITLAASYSYILANLSIDMMPTLLNKTRENFVCRVTNIIKHSSHKKEPYQLSAMRIQHACEIVCNSIEDYKRFFTGDELATIKRIIADEKRYLTKLAKDMVERHERLCNFFPATVEAQHITEDERLYQVPVRLVRGPVRLDRLPTAQLRQRYKKLSTVMKDLGMSSDIALFWANSKRNILEISKKVYLDTGYDNSNALYEYFSLLESAGYIRLK